MSYKVLLKNASPQQGSILLEGKAGRKMNYLDDNGDVDEFNPLRDCGWLND